MTERIVTLKVAEALQIDYGKRIVRLDSSAREQIGVTTGDVVEIKGKRSVAAIVLPAHPSDEGLGIIRMDGILRQNASVGLGDRVRISKAVIKPAKRIVLSPNQASRYAPGFDQYVKKNLIGKPLSKGDILSVNVFGTSFPFAVAQTNPAGLVIVTDQTEVLLHEEPIKELGKIATISYEDIGGLKDEVQKIREMVELPIRHPELFERLGIDAPRGVLVYGPPGTGKTLLAKAVANESEAHFITIAGPEVVSKFVGEAEEKLRKLFAEAEENAPSIIFIDEIDAIAPKREEVVGEVERRIVSQLLTLMDGLKSRGQVVVIGATNRQNSIDPALRRPGRFDREIEIGVPDKKGRKEILQIHTRGMPLDKDVTLDELAAVTHGFVGA
ncbi:AAA family ATPase, partial [Candidatus Micrarchaeota archaeon]|nr:AAA family ATPase [Candidatus Micrarchaeota archaeon]